MSLMLCTGANATDGKRSVAPAGMALSLMEFRIYSIFVEHGIELSPSFDEKQTQHRNFASLVQSIKESH